MKIAIISDTHDHLRMLDKAVKYLQTIECQFLIHCGDWDMPFTMRTLAQLKCPMKSVLGNGDPDIQKFLYQLQNLSALKGMDLEIMPRMLDIRLDGKRMAAMHGDDETMVKVAIESQLFDVVCVGHTHTSSIEQKGKTLVINPGSLVGFMAEKGTLPVTIAVYNTESNQAEIIDIEKV